MALPSSGPISLNDVNVELGLAGSTNINMNQSSVRVLFKKTADQSIISMSDGYGQARMPSSIEVLVVAGGGGAGSGGGGGGGVLPWFSITPTAALNYSITVGAAGPSVGTSNTGNGGDSQFTSSYVAIGGGGGGYGGATCSYTGRNGGSGGGSQNPCRGSSGSPGFGYTNTTVGQPTYNIVQGNRGGYGRDYGNFPYLSGGGGGQSGRGADGSSNETSGGAGYTIDAETRTVPPFNTVIAAYNTVTTTVASGGGLTGHTSNGGIGAGGASYGTNATMFGCGGYNYGVGRSGVVVIRYTGNNIGTGGNNITYVSSSDKTYHVFTSAGTFRFP
jgi:hypothetical protein